MTEFEKIQKTRDSLTQIINSCDLPPSTAYLLITDIQRQIFEILNVENNVDEVKNEIDEPKTVEEV